jgi:hypothetical protein
LKLKVLLLEFREKTGGEDFKWQGKSLIRELEGVSDAEIARMKKAKESARANKGRRVSAQPSKIAKVPTSPRSRRSIATGV